jgi:hypothetical protein
VDGVRGFLVALARKFADGERTSSILAKEIAISAFLRCFAVRQHFSRETGNHLSPKIVTGSYVVPVIDHLDARPWSRAIAST